MEHVEKIRKAYLDKAVQKSHYKDCYLVHPQCAILKLLETIVEIRQAIEKRQPSNG